MISILRIDLRAWDDCQAWTYESAAGYLSIIDSTTGECISRVLLDDALLAVATDVVVARMIEEAE